MASSAAADDGGEATAAAAAAATTAEEAHSSMPETQDHAPAAVAAGQEGGKTTTTSATSPTYVAPSSYLRPVPAPLRAQSQAASAASVAGSTSGESLPFRQQEQQQRPHSSGAGGGKMSGSGKRPVLMPGDREQIEGLRAIRAFLKVRTSYDVLPLSYRLIIFDTSLLVKRSLNVLIQCGIVSAPLWDSNTSTFAGLLTVNDYINVVQYYWQNPEALAQVDQFKLSSLRSVEHALGVTPIETISIHPLRPLYEACTRMLQSRARRIPLVDIDDETQREMVVSLVTQYRILKFVSINVRETQMLRKPLRELHGVGTYENLAIAHMDTPVMEVIHALVKRDISCVPILDKDGTVLNVFEAVDVIVLIKGGDYDNLNVSVGRALEKRADDFPGIYTCTINDRLDTIFDTIRRSRVHRFVIVDENKQLKGLLSLSDILNYTLNSPLGDEEE